MKFLNKFLLALLVPALFVATSCDKEESSANVSKVTNYPDFTIGGSIYESVVMGDAYTDPGVTATEGGASIDVTVSGSVDVNTVGIYTLTYSATNKDGFEGSVQRYVAVLPAPDAADISGSYANVGSFNYTATIEEVAPGFYRTDNSWGGGSGAIIPALFICVDGANIEMPLHQISIYGPIMGSGTIDATGLIEWELTLTAFNFTTTKMWQRI